jgi:hypothetical protein
MALETAHRFASSDDSDEPIDSKEACDINIGCL